MKGWRRAGACAWVIGWLCVVGVKAGAQTNAAAPAPPLWFPVGEELVYRIYWGVIPVGETIVTTGWVEEDGRKLLRIHYRTLSNKVLAAIYPVDDVIETIVEPESFRPVRFTKNLKEGRHRYHEVTTFDYDRLTARWESKIKNTTKEYVIAEDTRDLVSFMYYMRSQDLSKAAGRTYRVMADEKLYDLTFEVQGSEDVKMPLHGRVPGLKLEPKATFQGLFVRKGRMWMWVSLDARRLCTKVIGQVPVADIRVVLQEVRGPGDDFWAQPGKR